jgi:hypothetical protein
MTEKMTPEKCHLEVGTGTIEDVSQVVMDGMPILPQQGVCNIGDEHRKRITMFQKYMLEIPNPQAI